jgi:hypothetical protein
VYYLINQISKTQIKNKKRDSKKPVTVPIILEQLLEKITKDNQHGEFDTAPAVGKEFWQIGGVWKKNRG